MESFKILELIITITVILFALKSKIASTKNKRF